MPDMPVESMPTPERAPAPEVIAEEPVEQPTAVESAPVPESRPAAEAPSAEAIAPSPPPPAPAIDPQVAKIEKVLSEDLEEIYRKMPPDRQAVFQAKGQETVAKISALLAGAAVKAKQVLKLILEWLKLIPGVNRFFLEQESKIKTDKIMEIHRRSRGG